MNETKTENNSLKEKILKKIEAGEVSMKPKTIFIIKTVLIASVICLIFLVTVVLVSYMTFSIQTGGRMFLLGFGKRGLIQFLLMFPWILLTINAVLLIILDLLLKHFKFGYNRPLIYIFLTTLVVITILGSVINYTPFHRNLLRRAEEKHLPVFGSFYSGLRKSHRENGIFRGIVTSVGTSTFTFKHNDYDRDVDDTELKVFVPADVNIGTTINVGDQVFIAGDLKKEGIYAYGIKKLDTTKEVK
ncbi:MAG: hypothetical protein WAX85_00015 [Minisyncoccia bacterium]